MPYAIITKPIGPICNMGCRYCFYLEKKQLFGDHGSFRMSPEVLETFIRQYLALRDVPEVQFVWQGGSPGYGICGRGESKEAVRHG